MSGAAEVGTPLPALDPARYVPHPLHGAERIWAETNCYVDLWIELLHALGLEPLASGAFSLSTDFEGDQWTFFKAPPEDLRLLYGLEVAEMNVWRPLSTHVAEQLELGRLLTVEVDAWYLPDTLGVSYRQAHQKTTIVPTLLDLDGARMRYFHNAGYFELSGEDLAGALRLGAGEDVLPPYVELVRLERVRALAEEELVERASALAAAHLARRPSDNPVGRLAKRLEADLDWLAGGDLELFHAYAFGTCRQCGASAELAAEFVDWLEPRARRGALTAAASLRQLAEAMKTVQFGLARLARGRRACPGDELARASACWERATDELAACYG